jgi:hypothetical protein
MPVLIPPRGVAPYLVGTAAGRTLPGIAEEAEEDA